MYKQIPNLRVNDYYWILAGMLLSTFSAGMATGIVLWEAAR